jgi:hypothetical protein
MVSPQTGKTAPFTRSILPALRLTCAAWRVTLALHIAELSMSPRLMALPLLLTLAACVQDSAPVEPYAFVGSWDCGVDVFTFTNTTYNNGSETYPIRNVARDGDNYTLLFDKGYMIGLGAVTATGLTWVSGASGDQFNCRRVK